MADCGLPRAKVEDPGVPWTKGQMQRAAQLAARSIHPAMLTAVIFLAVALNLGSRKLLVLLTTKY